MFRRCREAAEHIRSGQYEEARESLDEFWRGTGSRPDVDGFGQRAAAEVLLQVGALSGWLGATRHGEGAQEAAKDLLSESAALFEGAGDRAVRALEGGRGSAVFADALTTRGVVWSRLGVAERSAEVLRRAVRVAEEAGALSNAARAAMTLIEEQGGGAVQTRTELCDLYRRADDLLRGTQDAEDLGRLRACARIVTRELAGPAPGDASFRLCDAVHALEERYIGRALEAAGGSVSRAAGLLGLRHQSFIAMLNSRHRKLLPKRSPAAKRLRSILGASK